MSQSSESSWLTRKRKYEAIACFANTSESYMQHLHPSDASITKTIDRHEADNKLLFLPEDWDLGLKKPHAINFIQLTELTKNYPVHLHTPPKTCVNGMPSLSIGMKKVFDHHQFACGDSILLLREHPKQIWFHVFGKDVPTGEKYSTSFAHFQTRFGGDKRMAAGDQLPYEEADLLAYWAVTLGEGNISVHKAHCMPDQSVQTMDNGVRMIIRAYQQLQLLGADPITWSDRLLEELLEQLGVCKATGYSVTKLLALTDSYIAYRKEIKECQARMTGLVQAVESLRVSYHEKTNALGPA